MCFLFALSTNVYVPFLGIRGILAAIDVFSDHVLVGVSVPVMLIGVSITFTSNLVIDYFPEWKLHSIVLKDHVCFGA